MNDKLDCIWLLKDGNADEPEREILATFASYEEAEDYLKETIGETAFDDAMNSGDYWIEGLALPSGYILVKE